MAQVLLRTRQACPRLWSAALGTQTHGRVASRSPRRVWPAGSHVPNERTPAGRRMPGRFNTPCVCYYRSPAGWPLSRCDALRDQQLPEQPSYLMASYYRRGNTLKAPQFFRQVPVHAPPFTAISCLANRPLPDRDLGKFSVTKEAPWPGQDMMPSQRRIAIRRAFPALIPTAFKAECLLATIAVGSPIAATACLYGSPDTWRHRPSPPRSRDANPSP
ncbi:hypothetical protein QBC40DRAFT_350159 [Triangularia verruculosa]|uniref:Uncharacterized protein n=1 Tax=Triangularia verruculosa TaxID=2587418 RepID=A0AAN6XIQ0_9PEZI|nr:hypothetical protein QBC40DRAFT_350159 [Triangularia verruculosa]